MNFSSTEPPNFKKIVLAEILQIDFIYLMFYTEVMAAGGKECPPPCIIIIIFIIINAQIKVTLSQ